MSYKHVTSLNVYHVASPLILTHFFALEQSFFAERFFHIFDKEKTEHISLKELKEGLSQLISGSVTDKLRFLFQVYDIDGEEKKQFRC